ncbi:ParB/RepB/Spo0J family partition protein [Sharpea azabuensis]|uniref:ParB/RepB/Spo0J family partition protein n=1 Tax=Sharpea azabuensis TaxID=322505 RepID=UPI0015691107|nr:ParB/RepB/Spo0J family partition protein [Sharpea azabuensis]
MPAKKKSRGLGNGLNELIPQKIKEVENTTVSYEKGTEIVVPISKVEPDRNQPRKNFNEDALLELSESIKQYGIFQPLLVQEKDDYFQIIAGERRWRAAKMAGVKEIPVIVRTLTEREIAEIQLLENIQREDLNPIEIAEGYKELIEKYDMTQDELAERVSKSRTAITNALRLLKLDERVRKMVIDEMISTGHARAILGITDLDKQYEFAQRVFDEKLSVREVEREVKKINSDKKNNAKPEKIDKQTEIIYQNLEEQMKQKMGTKVLINPKKNGKGKIEIEYYSNEELNRIVELINGISNN